MSMKFQIDYSFLIVSLWFSVHYIDLIFKALATVRLHTLAQWSECFFAHPNCYNFSENKSWEFFERPFIRSCESMSWKIFTSGLIINSDQQRDIYIGQTIWIMIDYHSTREFTIMVARRTKIVNKMENGPLAIQSVCNLDWPYGCKLIFTAGTYITSDIYVNNDLFF